MDVTYPAWLLLAVITTLVSPQTPPRDQASPPRLPTGTARISGVVVAADNGVPVKRANVTIIGVSSPPPELLASGVFGGSVGGAVVGVTTTMTGSGGVMINGQQMPSRVTDETGRFEFADLAAGIYSLQVVPQGGFVRPQRLPSVRVADGESATVTIKLDRTGAIGGRILDEGGDPLPRARVTAFRRGGPGGGLSSLSSAMTDDQGRYRVFDLAPGEYFITATSQGMSYGAEPAVGSPGFAPTYYPGSAAIDGAQAVTVKSGDDISGVDFPLVRAPMGRVTGTVRDSSGQILTSGRGNMPGVSVMLTPRLGDMSMSSSRGGGVRPDGTFIISAVPPGDYYVTASVLRGTGPEAQREGAFAPVTVNGDEVPVDLRTNVGATIAGRVVTEGTPPPMPPLPPGLTGRAGGPPRPMVMARPVFNGAPAAAGGNMRPVTVEEDGTFTLTGVRGAVTLTASPASRAVLKSILVGGKEVAGKMLEFKGTESFRNVLITLTTDVGRVEGTVAVAGAKPGVDAWVVAFSDDPEHWFAGSPFVYLTRTLGELPPWAAPAVSSVPPVRREPGSFVIPSLAPGRYYIAAVEGSMGGGPPQDRASLEKLRDGAKLITVTAGQTATVQIRLDKP